MCTSGVKWHGIITYQISTHTVVVNNSINNSEICVVLFVLHWLSLASTCESVSQFSMGWITWPVNSVHQKITFSHFDRFTKQSNIKVLWCSLKDIPSTPYLHVMKVAKNLVRRGLRFLVVKINFTWLRVNESTQVFIIFK